VTLTGGLGLRGAERNEFHVRGAESLDGLRSGAPREDDFEHKAEVAYPLLVAQFIMRRRNGWAVSCRRS
jgi:hypothetical protein